MYASKERLPLYLRLNSKENYRVFFPPRTFSRNAYGCEKRRYCFNNLSFRGPSCAERSYSRHKLAIEKLLSHSMLADHKSLKKKGKSKESTTKQINKGISIKKNYESFGVKINKCKLVKGRTVNSSEKYLKKEFHIYVKAVPHDTISVGINTDLTTPNKSADKGEENKVLNIVISGKRKSLPSGQRLKVRNSCRNIQKRATISKGTTFLNPNSSTRKHLYLPIPKLCL